MKNQLSSCTTADRMASFLLALPLELRLHIFAYVLAFDPFEEISSDRSPFWKSYNSLLLTNRQLYTEAMQAWLHVPHVVSIDRSQIFFLAQKVTMDGYWSRDFLHVWSPSWFVGIRNLEINIFWNSDGYYTAKSEELFGFLLFLLSERLRVICDVVVQCNKLSTLRIRVKIRPKDVAYHKNKPSLRTFSAVLNMILDPLRELRSIKKTSIEVEDSSEETNRVLNDIQSIMRSNALRKPQGAHLTSWLEKREKFRRLPRDSS